MPRVGFNAMLLSLAADYRAAGIHRYIVGLLTALADRGDFTLHAFTAEPRARAALPASIGLTVLPAPLRRPALRIVWEQLGLPLALRRHPAAALHGAAYALPAWGGPPAVATVHDLSFFRLPETLPPAQAAYLRRATRQALRRAAALIAVSEFTKRELVALLGARPEQVHVVPNGLDPACRPPPPAALAAYRARAGLPEAYLLSLGTLQPRKNLGTLLEAYAELRRRMPAAPPLVLAGAPGWGEEDPARRAEALGLAASVRLLGFVPAADLPALYGGATAFAYPSRYEGFGLPVLEALACGAPTVVADASSLPEVAGDAALRVPPDDAAGWATALEALLADPSLAARLRERGLARASQFSWARAARETAAVYHQALAAPASGRRPWEATRDRA